MGFPEQGFLRLPFVWKQLGLPSAAQAFFPEGVINSITLKTGDLPDSYWGNFSYQCYYGDYLI